MKDFRYITEEELVQMPLGLQRIMHSSLIEEGWTADKLGEVWWRPEGERKPVASGSAPDTGRAVSMDEIKALIRSGLQSGLHVADDTVKWSLGRVVRSGKAAGEETKSWKRPELMLRGVRVENPSALHDKENDKTPFDVTITTASGEVYVMRPPGRWVSGRLFEGSKQPSWVWVCDGPHDNEVARAIVVLVRGYVEAWRAE